MMQTRARRIASLPYRSVGIASSHFRFGSTLLLPYARIALRATSNFPH
jgi:hypothetical protein